MKVTTILSGKPVECEVVKENSKTVLVKSPRGKIIKRHKDKHIVQPE